MLHPCAKFIRNSTRIAPTPRSPSQTPGEWVNIAKWRVRETLRANVVCSTKELEARISDFAPTRLPSPNPHHLTTARADLIGEGVIVSRVANGTEFYSLAVTPPSEAEPEFASKSKLHSDFVSLTGDYDKCGKSAEMITYRALLRGNAHWVPLKPGTPVNHLNGFETSHGLDLAAYGRAQQYRLGIEVKNIREWVYPESWPVWKVIGASIELQAVPILVARRIHHTTFRLFKRIGAIGHETKAQSFSPDINAQEASILETVKERFFFKDVIATGDPTQAQVDFFSAIVPRLAPHFGVNFDQHSELLRRYAISENMWDADLSTPTRTRLYQQFANELRATDGGGPDLDA